MVRNSIYASLESIAAGKSDVIRVLGLAYSLAITKRKAVRSGNPLADEGQNVYVTLDTMGISNLEDSPGTCIYLIESAIADKTRIPREGSVEEVVLKMFEKFEFDEVIYKIGSTLNELIKQKTISGKPVKDIPAGEIQKYEQKLILKTLSEYVVEKKQDEE